MPIDLVKSTLATLAAGGEVAHAYLGVHGADSASATAGATVADVTSGGPAADAGLRAGDIVTAFDGAKVEDSNALVTAIAGHKPGDEVGVTVQRGSDTLHFDVTLSKQPAQSPSDG